jgi:leader peptidase (prepilin peptidase)/N-methyltransferase
MLAKGAGTKYAIPFGPFLSLGALVYVFFGNTLIHLTNNFLGIY